MLSDTLIEFLLQFKKKGSITKKTQTMFSGLGYYLAIWRLRDDGLILNDGITNRNEKVWRLTERGRDIIQLLEKRVSVEKEIEERFKK
jgi:hypothetical protein